MLDEKTVSAIRNEFMSSLSRHPKKPIQDHEDIFGGQEEQAHHPASERSGCTPGESGEAAESRPGCETAGQASQGSPGECGKAAESRPRSETAGKASQDMIKMDSYCKDRELNKCVDCGGMFLASEIIIDTTVQPFSWQGVLLKRCFG